MMRWAGVADFTGWATDTTSRVIDLDELIPGCPERDCIPSIDDPVFESISHGDAWLDASAPVAVTYTNAFWFGWSEFRPDTRVVRH